MIAPFLRWISVCLVVLTAPGCVHAPVQEMSNARQAIKAARDAGAERVAPDEFAEALTLLQRAEASLQKRLYREARRNAVAAHDKAAKALQTVQPRPTQLSPGRTDVHEAEADAQILAAG